MVNTVLNVCSKCELVREVEQLLQERQLMQKAYMDRTSKINELLLQLDAQCNHNKTLASENQALLDKCDAFMEAEIALQRLVCYFTYWHHRVSFSYL